jgi:hypothetical protein
MGVFLNGVGVELENVSIGASLQLASEAVIRMNTIIC